VSRRTIYNRIRDGRLQTVRTLGGSQRVTLDSVVDLGGRRPNTDSQKDVGSKVVRRTVAPTIVATLLLLLASIEPASAQRRARISRDLADHLSAGSQKIDVIVNGDAQTISALARKYNVAIKKSMRSGAVLQMNASQLAVVQGDEAIDHLSGDSRVHPASVVDVTAETIGADQLWTRDEHRKAVSGKGVGVAVIDSGIDTAHTAFGRRVLASVDFTGGDGGDRYGHGTHVASIIAGRPGTTAETAQYRGIAYGAYLINLRALGDDGSGVVSDVIEAIDWAVDHRRQFNIRVINLSLGTPVRQTFRDDPLCEAVERAARAGILVVAAAGNHGLTPGGQTQLGAITSPGNSPYALTVGALDTHETPHCGARSAHRRRRVGRVVPVAVAERSPRGRGRTGCLHATVRDQHVERRRQRRRSAAVG
jgi:serine protease AprX